MSVACGFVLYVEDEESDVILLKRAFACEGLGDCLRTLPDGRMAIQYLSGGAEFADRSLHPLPAVVLLDMNLPEIHGFDVLRWIRSRADFRTLPVVIYSSSNREEDCDRAKALGADDCIQKPIAPSQLTTIVRDLSARWLAAGRAASAGCDAGR